jgi:hypothetical protein
LARVIPPHQERPGLQSVAKRSSAYVLTQSPDARILHNRRFLLSFREPFSPFSIDIDASKRFAIRIRHGHQPVMVFAALVFVEVCNSAFRHEGTPTRQVS